MGENAKASYDYWVLCTCLDGEAKRWWGISQWAKLFGFLVGAAAIALAWPAKPIPFVLAAFTLIAELSVYRSDAVRGAAQGLRRKLDLWDGFGWEVPNTDYSDILVRCPRSVKSRAEGKVSTEPYFASLQKPGGRRALENVTESAWWSKHLSEQMGHLCLAALVVTVILAVAALIFTLNAASDQDTLSVVARVVTALLMLSLSLGFVRMILGYYGFSKKATKAEDSAERLLKAGKTKELDALKVVNEYHVARAGAPIIPTWFWEWKRGEMNRLWKEFRLEQDSGTDSPPAPSR